MSTANVVKMLNESAIIAKILKSDSVEVDNFGFCRHFNFNSDDFDSIFEAIVESDEPHNGFPVLSESEIKEHLDTVVLEISFVDDAFEKYEFYFSVKELLEGKVLDDGSVEIEIDIESDTGKIVKNKTLLKFYTLTMV